MTVVDYQLYHRGSVLSIPACKKVYPAERVCSAGCVLSVFLEKLGEHFRVEVVLCLFGRVLREVYLVLVKLS